jgi:hypothetical protein
MRISIACVCLAVLLVFSSTASAQQQVNMVQKVDEVILKVDFARGNHGILEMMGYDVWLAISVTCHPEWRVDYSKLELSQEPNVAYAIGDTQFAECTGKKEWIWTRLMSSYAFDPGSAAAISEVVVCNLTNPYDCRMSRNLELVRLKFQGPNKK